MSFTEQAKMIRHDQDVLIALTRSAASLSLPCGGGLAWQPVTSVDTAQLPEALRSAAARRRNCFAAGRRAARSALTISGCKDDILLEPDSDGLPIWPKRWRGSITHTDALAAAVVAPADSCAILGLDLERIIASQTALELASTIMPEAAPGTAGMSPDLELTRTFSAKEALYKALFPTARRFREFSAARVTWRTDKAGGLPQASLILTEDWGDNWPRGTVINIRQIIAEGFVLSLVWE